MPRSPTRARLPAVSCCWCEPGTRTVQATCPHDCPDTCAIRVTVEGGRAVKVQGHPDHPPTQGALCTKVSRYPERTYHPERVLQPMRRSGPKGSGRFEPIGWDEALDLIATRLKAIAARDPQAILPYSYAGTMGLVQGDGMAARFFHKLGASLLDRTICASAGGDALAATYGGKVGMHFEHFAESRLILIWGSNSIASNLHFWTLAQQAKRNGARLVCIDPRRTETADKCHQHIALLPGTDGALALGLMHELIRQDLLDHDYLARHVDDWPKLRERAMGWSAQRAAEVCGITAEEIVQLAAEYGRTRPAAIRLNYGMQRVRGGGNAVRLVALLPCLVGAWRHRAGGLLLSSSGWFRGARNDAALQRPDLLAGRRPRTINMSTIGDDLLRETSPAFGPRIEAVVVYNSNPVAVAPDSGKVVAGFAREDLFTVVLEHFMTDTADHADIVLPATTQLEHWDVHTSYGHTYAMLNQPAVPPLGQSRSNAAIFRALAVRMGFDEPCFSDDDARHGAPGLPSGPRAMGRTAAHRLGQVAHCRGAFRRGRIPHADRPRRGRCTGPGRARPCAQLRVRDVQSRSRAPLPAGHDLAARAQLPQFDLRQREEPARHRGRAARRDPSRRRRSTRHRRRRDGADIQRPRQLQLSRIGGRAGKTGRGECTGHLVAQVQSRRQQRQRTYQPEADRYRARAHVLRLPG
jgi:anaerobic selenocysteine-containing dehydrogenase